MTGVLNSVSTLPGTLQIQKASGAFMNISRGRPVAFTTFTFAMDDRGGGPLACCGGGCCGGAVEEYVCVGGGCCAGGTVVYVCVGGCEFGKGCGGGCAVIVEQVCAGGGG